MSRTIERRMTVTRDPALFFQIAAGLIPVLLFGSVLTDKLEPPKFVRQQTARGWAFFVLLLVLGNVVVLAEITAISAAITGEAAVWQARLVAAVIAVGTVGLVAAIAWPYLKALRPPDMTDRTFARLATLMGLVALFVIVVAVQTLGLAVSTAQFEAAFGGTTNGKLNIVSASFEDREKFRTAYVALTNAREATGQITHQEANRLRLCAAAAGVDNVQAERLINAGETPQNRA